MTSYAMRSSSFHLGISRGTAPSHPNHHGQLRSFMQPSNSFLSFLFHSVYPSNQSFREAWRAEPASLVPFPAVTRRGKSILFFFSIFLVSNNYGSRFHPSSSPKLRGRNRHEIILLTQPLRVGDGDQGLDSHLKASAERRASH
ncbi:hypothetical protein V8C26DRAFT_251812 [Trichoderma gracile]